MCNEGANQLTGRRIGEPAVVIDLATSAIAVEDDASSLASSLASSFDSDSDATGDEASEDDDDDGDEGKVDCTNAHCSKRRMAAHK
jgi:hypothetical protein